ncbi:MAG TPA: GDSL-type esterase/lipase family protein [Anaerolineales bacterium]|nr:GDSL-type esterase/lipase family protein [Anaerolineales bacterium]
MTTLLLIGSSIFEAWRELPTQAPGYVIRNRAVGGTVTAQWVEWLPEVLAQEAPAAVLFYCGSNDLNEGVPEPAIAANTLACRQVVHDLAPEARFAYFGIIKAPQKLGKWDVIDRVHAAIRAELPARDLFIDTDPVFVRDGRPVEPFFVEDRLHLTPEAYAALAADAVPRISAWLTAPMIERDCHV